MSDPHREAVLATVEAMLAAYCARDIEATLSFFSRGPELTCIGSGPGEKSLGYESLSQNLGRDFSEADELSLTYSWRTVEILPHAGDEPQAAWCAMELVFSVPAEPEDGGEDELLAVAARFSAVVQREDGAWKIVHTHLSLPFPPEDDEFEDED
jgi:hypothetical protein